MQTTELFVELVVIGYGMIIWIFLLIMTLFGFSWIDFNKIISTQTILPSLVMAYVFGIITDRFADWIFRSWDRSIRNKQFNKKLDYQRTRTIVFDRSESLKAWFYYGRSRLRICRGWAINLLFLMVSFNLFISNQPLPQSLNRYTIITFINSSVLLMTFGAMFSWYRLTASEYERLAQEYESFLQGEKGNTKA
jgi:hypothetical protein